MSQNTNKEVKIRYKKVDNAIKNLRNIHQTYSEINLNKIYNEKYGKLNNNNNTGYSIETNIKNKDYNAFNEKLKDQILLEIITQSRHQNFDENGSIYYNDIYDTIEIGNTSSKIQWHDDNGNNVSYYVPSRSEVLSKKQLTAILNNDANNIFNAIAKKCSIGEAYNESFNEIYANLRNLVKRLNNQANKLEEKIQDYQGIEGKIKKDFEDEFSGKNGKKYKKSKIAKTYSKMVDRYGKKKAKEKLKKMLASTGASIPASKVISIYNKWKTNGGNIKGYWSQKQTPNLDNKDSNISSQMPTVDKNTENKNNQKGKKSTKTVSLNATTASVISPAIPVVADAIVESQNDTEQTNSTNYSDLAMKRDLYDEGAIYNSDLVKNYETIIEKINNIDPNDPNAETLLESYKQELKNLNEQSTRNYNGNINIVQNKNYDQDPYNTFMSAKEVEKDINVSEQTNVFYSEKLDDIEKSFDQVIGDKLVAIKKVSSSNAVDTPATEIPNTDLTPNNQTTAQVTVEPIEQTPTSAGNETSSNNVVDYDVSSNSNFGTNSEVLVPDENEQSIESAVESSIDTPNSTEPSITDKKTENKVISIEKEETPKKNNNSSSGLGAAIPIGLGIAATGAAAVAGTRYLKNRKLNEDIDDSYDDENNDLDEEEDIPSDSAYMRDDYLGSEPNSDVSDNNSYTDVDDFDNQEEDDFSNDAVLNDLESTSVTNDFSEDTALN